MESNDCIFCKIAGKDVKSEIIYENDNFVVFPDADPKTEGHCLIVTKKHFINFLDIPQSLGIEFFEAVKNVADKKLRSGFDGFNLVQNNGNVAGQVVNHFHVHFLPRKKEDGKSLNLE